MIDFVDPACIADGYTTSNGYCFGGYESILNYRESNIAGLIDRRLGAFGVYQLVNNLDYQPWLLAKREGRFEDAFTILASGTSINTKTPEEIMMYLGALNTALVGYDKGAVPISKATNTIDRPINQVCGLE
jgi:hypothetical protein